MFILHVHHRGEKVNTQMAVRFENLYTHCKGEGRKDRELMEEQNMFRKDEWALRRIDGGCDNF